MQYKCVYMVHLKESKYAICTKKDEINDEVTWNDCLSINHLFHYWLFWRSPSENTCAFILCTDGISPNLTYIYKEKKNRIVFYIIVCMMCARSQNTCHHAWCLAFSYIASASMLLVGGFCRIAHRTSRMAHAPLNKINVEALIKLLTGHAATDARCDAGRDDRRMYVRWTLKGRLRA